MRHGTNTQDSKAIATQAKGALERVCSGAGLDPASAYYSPKFVDHVNDMEFYGLAGTEESVELYKAILSDVRVEVQEQLVDGDRVTSRFVVTGQSLGRHVRFNGITISRFEDGLIVEDWSVTDTVGMLRQLGVWRSLWMAMKSWRTLAAPSGRSRRSKEAGTLDLSAACTAAAE
jgi:predicted ester cyclase